MKLAWIESPATIILFVHEDIIEEIDSIPITAPIIEHFSSKLGPYISTSDQWGFQGCLKRLPKDADGFTAFRIELPIIKKFRDELCSHCDGTGKNEEHWKGICLHCEGNGHPLFYDWSLAEAISASITLLANRIKFSWIDRELTAKTPQLLSFETCTDTRNHAIGAECSSILVNWFRAHGPDDLEEPTRAMQNAWKTMMGNSDDHPYPICAEISSESGRLFLHCPGDACGLFPSFGHDDPFGGYELDCHNLDDAMQQFTLLAGLAATEMQARKELGL